MSQCCNHDEKSNDNIKKDSSVLIHHSAIKEEFFCHFPYAVFSVAAAMILVSFVYCGEMKDQSGVAYRLFHNFHFLHLLFAASGTVLMFRRYSKNILAAIAVGLVVPTIFCTFSDAFLPYLGGKMLGLGMHFHWCFIKHIDKVLPFLVGGVINGFIMSAHGHSQKIFYSLGFHFSHIFVSSIASLMYLISFGFAEFWGRMGFVFLYLVLAVLLPCIMSDIVVPVYFASFKSFKKDK